MTLCDYTFLGLTQSLCPECLGLVPTKIIVRDGGRVYFRKRCSTHGEREDFVCADVRWYDRMEFSVPGKLPAEHGVDPERGCPYDCGLCTEHEQHTCVGVVEVTSNCNLHCPMCYAASGPGGEHRTFDECRRMIDRLVEVEGRAEVLQFSGGEPTIHPDFERLLDYAFAQPIDVVMVNTNGIRLARDPALVAMLSGRRQRVEAYLQFDSLRARDYQSLRGEDLLALKLRAVEALGAAGVRITLVTTLQPDVNVDQMGDLVRFGLERPWVTGVSFQPATYCGRHVLPETLERRVTFPDVIRGVAEQTGGLFAESDFLPLPCAHPNCHSLAYAYRQEGHVLPLARIIDAKQHPDLLANGITFTRPKARQLIEQFLGRMGCCAGGNCDPGMNGNKPAAARTSLPVVNGVDSPRGVATQDALAAEFFERALKEDLSSADVFRVTITSFLDAYNFDVRRVMKCCIHHVLPSGHVIPFCAYNVLYRDGHVPLPPLTRRAPVAVEAE